MKLRNQVLSLGMLGVLMTTLVGGKGLLIANQMADAFDSAMNVSLVLSKSQEIDMMHDAIRGDVLQALLVARDKDTQALSAGDESLKEHIENLNVNLTSMLGLPMSSEVRQHTVAALPLVRTYIDSAERVQSLARTDYLIATKEYQSFQQSFTKLETALDAQSKAVQKSVDSFGIEVRNLAVNAKLIIFIGVMVAAGGLIILSLWLSRLLSAPLEIAVKMAKRLADGDLTATFTPEGNDETRHMMSELARMQTNIADVVSQIQLSSKRLSLTSVEFAQGNVDLSTRTEQQANALEQTTGSMSDLNARVQKNSEKAFQATQQAVNASLIAKRGGEVVDQVVMTMKDINVSSHKINDITSLIDGIAFRTNILALNAAVEAARAGEQGRSFAVVASEVRLLASRSAEAAREIKVLINTSMERVDQGTVLVDKAGATMKEVVSSIHTVSDLMGEISSASAEQTAGVKQIDQAIVQMEHMTQQNAALVEQMSAAATNLKLQANELVNAISIFQIANDSNSLVMIPN